MSVVIRNLQRAVNVNPHQLHLDTLLLKKLCGYEQFELGVLLVTNRHIKKLNRLYRQQNEVTDVLAFPYQDIKPNEIFNHLQLMEEERMLGDIVLGLSYILTESQKQKEDFDSILMTMITHGLCHLIGFDHETKEDCEQMYRKEIDILQRFNTITGYRCSPLLGVGH